MIHNSFKKGQAMILTTIMIGAVILSATAIAGLLTFYQLRQSNDIVSSAMAFFAADAGVERALNCYFYRQGNFGVGEGVTNSSCDLSIRLANQASASFNLDCNKNVFPGEVVECDGSEGEVVGFRVTSLGEAANSERALETFVYTKSGAR